MKVYHNCARDNDNDNDDIKQNMNVSDGIKGIRTCLANPSRFQWKYKASDPFMYLN